MGGFSTLKRKRLPEGQPPFSYGFPMVFGASEPLEAGLHMAQWIKNGSTTTITEAITTRLLPVISMI